MSVGLSDVTTLEFAAMTTIVQERGKLQAEREANARLNPND